MGVNLGEVSPKAFKLTIWVEDDVCCEAVTAVVVSVLGDEVGT
jgi:hypothetical protein